MCRRANAGFLLPSPACSGHAGSEVLLQEREKQRNTPETGNSGEQAVALSEDVQRVLLLGDLTLPKADRKQREVPVEEITQGVSY